MSSLSKLEIYTNYVEARNTLEQWLNHRAPEVIARLSAAGYKTKEDGSLYKKDADGIRAILNTNCPEGCKYQAYLDVTTYRIYISAKAWYSNDEFGCAYIKRDVYVADPRNRDFEPEFHPYKKVTLKQYQSGRDELIKIQDQLHELQRKHSFLKSKWDL